MNILILAAGRVQASTSAEHTYPACLTELNGVSVLESIVSNLANIAEANYIFALHAEDISSFHLDNIAKLLVPNAKIKVVPKSTMGSACTALLVACELEVDHPLLIISANELVREDIAAVLEHFTAQGLDAGTLVFRSVHPRYSYVRLNKDGLVIEAAQQNPISQVATSGIFWFARAGDFIESAKDAIRKGAATNGCFYLAPVFNELILKQMKIGVKEIDKIDYIPLKSANQIQQYEQGQ
jgi:NDP-sugar pyrophosphorylase family protein